jgi:hypothetical protein
MNIRVRMAVAGAQHALGSGASHQLADRPPKRIFDSALHARINHAKRLVVLEDRQAHPLRLPRASAAGRALETWLVPNNRGKGRKTISAVIDLQNLAGCWRHVRERAEPVDTPRRSHPAGSWRKGNRDRRLEIRVAAWIEVCRSRVALSRPVRRREWSVPADTRHGMTFRYRCVSRHGVAKTVAAQQSVPSFWDHDAALYERPKKIDFSVCRCPHVGITGCGSSIVGRTPVNDRHL